MRYTEILSTGQKFYIKGKNPSLFIMSGIHGDEYEIVPIVEKMVEKYENLLPNFLYIPEASPSAVSLKTRKDVNGLDLNRNFFEGTSSLEVQEIMKLCKSYRFELYATFHEDPKCEDEFYLYDGVTAKYKKELQLKHSESLKLLRKDLTQLKLRLYSGLDDPRDPDLGYQVKRGYSFWPMIHNDRSSDYWLLVDAGIAKQVINPEIPGMASTEMKQAITEVIFKRLLIKNK